MKTSALFYTRNLTWTFHASKEHLYDIVVDGLLDKSTANLLDKYVSISRVFSKAEFSPGLTVTVLLAGFEFFEASAKDNINVKQTFERLVDIICEKMSESLDAGDPAVTGAKQGPQLTEQPAAPQQDCA